MGAHAGTEFKTTYGRPYIHTANRRRVHQVGSLTLAPIIMYGGREGHFAFRKSHFANRISQITFRKSQIAFRILLFTNRISLFANRISQIAFHKSHFAFRFSQIKSHFTNRISQINSWTSYLRKVRIQQVGPRVGRDLAVALRRHLRLCAAAPR